MDNKDPQIRDILQYTLERKHWQFPKKLDLDIAWLLNDYGFLDRFQVRLPVAGSRLTVWVIMNQQNLKHLDVILPNNKNFMQHLIKQEEEDFLLALWDPAVKHSLDIVLTKLKEDFVKYHLSKALECNNEAVVQLVNKLQMRTDLVENLEVISLSANQSRHRFFFSLKLWDDDVSQEDCCFPGPPFSDSDDASICLYVKLEMAENSNEKKVQLLPSQGMMLLADSADLTLPRYKSTMEVCEYLEEVKQGVLECHKVQMKRLDARQLFMATLVAEFGQAVIYVDHASYFEAQLSVKCMPRKLPVLVQVRLPATFPYDFPHMEAVAIDPVTTLTVRQSLLLDNQHLSVQGVVEYVKNFALSEIVTGILNQVFCTVLG